MIGPLLFPTRHPTRACHAPPILKNHIFWSWFSFSFSSLRSRKIKPRGQIKKKIKLNIIKNQQEYSLNIFNNYYPKRKTKQTRSTSNLSPKSQIPHLVLPFSSALKISELCFQNWSRPIKNIAQNWTGFAFDLGKNEGRRFKLVLKMGGGASISWWIDAPFPNPNHPWSCTRIRHRNPHSQSPAAAGPTASAAASADVVRFRGLRRAGIRRRRGGAGAYSEAAAAGVDAAAAQAICGRRGPFGDQKRRPQNHNAAHERRWANPGERRQPSAEIPPLFEADAGDFRRSNRRRRLRGC